MVELGIKNRGDRIRTCDLGVPNAALYQAEPRPDEEYDIIKDRCMCTFLIIKYEAEKSNGNV